MSRSLGLNNWGMVAAWSRGSWSTVCPTNWSRCFLAAKKPVLLTFDWYCHALQLSSRSSFTYGLGLWTAANAQCQGLNRSFAMWQFWQRMLMGTMLLCCRLVSEWLAGLSNMWTANTFILARFKQFDHLPFSFRLSSTCWSTAARRTSSVFWLHRFIHEVGVQVVSRWPGGIFFILLPRFSSLSLPPKESYKLSAQTSLTSPAFWQKLFKAFVTCKSSMSRESFAEILCNDFVHQYLWWWIHSSPCSGEKKVTDMFLCYWCCNEISHVSA